MKSSINLFIISLLTQMTSVASFAPNNLQPTQPRHRTSSESTTSIQMMDDPQQYLSSIQSASTYLSTVSADIDSMPQNEFATVFAGGIAVMIGSVISTLIVGFLLENGNSYASVVADSYAQGGDEEFWESLSPEDQVKTKELLEKLRKSKEGGDSADAVSVEEFPSDAKVAPVPAKSEKKEELSMFNDYYD